MEIFTYILIDTIIGLVIVTILLALIIYWNNQRLDLKRNENILKLKFRKTLSYAYALLFYFSLFIHWGVFVIDGILKGDKPGLALEFRFSSIFGILMSLIVLITLFFISTPNIIVLFQFIKNELGRVIKINEEENTIEIQTRQENIVIKKIEIENIEFHIMKHFVYIYYEFNYIKIIMKDKSSIVITDLLTDVNGFSELKFMYNGVKKHDLKKYFNLINCG